MHRTRIIRITLALLCALPLAANAQQGLVPKPQRPLGMAPPGDRTSPVYIEADRLEGRGENEAEATGNVQLRRDGQAVFADRLRYNANSQDVEATGNVRVEQGRDLLEGDRLRYNLGTQRGFIESPTFRITPVPRDPAAAASADAVGSAAAGIGAGTRQRGAHSASRPRPAIAPNRRATPRAGRATMTGLFERASSTSTRTAT